jgi:hypothetical protein
MMPVGYAMCYEERGKERCFSAYNTGRLAFNG